MIENLNVIYMSHLILAINRFDTETIDKMRHKLNIEGKEIIGFIFARSLYSKIEKYKLEKVIKHLAEEKEAEFYIVTLDYLMGKKNINEIFETWFNSLEDVKNLPESLKLVTMNIANTCLEYAMIELDFEKMGKIEEFIEKNQ